VPGIATCGAFVVIIHRASWWSKIEQWEENVTGAYQSLIQDPCIDRQQVFLFGASAETKYLSECVVKSPGLWKGLMLLNPTELPDFSKSPPFQSRPKILISTGGEEHQENRIKKYQADALQSGVLVEYLVHPGEGHHLVGNAAQLERTKAMMHFIFEE
jgi:predicted esterase